MSYHIFIWRNRSAFTVVVCVQCHLNYLLFCGINGTSAFEVCVDILRILHEQYDDGNQWQKGNHHLVYLDTTHSGDVEPHECDAPSMQGVADTAAGLYFLGNIQKNDSCFQG